MLDSPPKNLRAVIGIPSCKTMSTNFNRPGSWRRLAVVAISAGALGAAAATAQGQVLLGQIDQFTSDDQGWSSGADIVHPAPPEQVPDAGPGGLGDGALQIEAVGGSGPGSRLVAINRSQWTGDFLEAGVTGIRLDLRNVGATDLTVRLSFAGFLGSTWFSTTESVFLPSASGWQTAEFSLTEADMTRVQGAASYAATFADISEMRILHNPAPDLRGAPGTIGLLLVDNITAVPEPGATATVVMGLAGAAGVWLQRRARAGM
jgi:hypothetical protein